MLGINNRDLQVGSVPGGKGVAGCIALHTPFTCGDNGDSGALSPSRTHAFMHAFSEAAALALVPAVLPACLVGVRCEYSSHTLTSDLQPHT
jgi:hypothetical protein